MYPSVLIELQITGEREGWNTHSIDSMTDHTIHVVNELFFLSLLQPWNSRKLFFLFQLSFPQVDQ